MFQLKANLDSRASAQACSCNTGCERQIIISLRPDSGNLLRLAKLTRIMQMPHSNLPTASGSDGPFNAAIVFCLKLFTRFHSSCAGGVR